MLSPEYILRLSVGAEEVAGQLQSELISQIVTRLLTRLANEDEIKFSSTDKYAIKTLQDAGILLKDVQKQIAKYTKIQQKEIKKAFENAGIEAVKLDNKVYQQAGLSEFALQQSPHLIRLLQRNYEVTMGLWDNYTLTTADVVQQTFIQECNKVHTAVASTAVPYNTAIMDSVRRLVSQDIKSVIYTHPDGTVHRDNIEVATLRAVRTGVNQACAYITAQTSHDDGIYMFGTSAHVGARPEHTVWQGKVFWVDWDELNRRTGVEYGDAIPVPDDIKARYQEFCEATDIGTVTGLCGANCRHSYYPFIEGLDYNPFPPIDQEENEKAYALSQEQRKKERAIRKQKQKIQGLEASINTAPNSQLQDKWQEQHRKAVKKLQEQNADYRKFCKDNDLKPQEFRLYTG